MDKKHCVLCGGKIGFHYYTLPFGFICYDCGKKIIEHLQVVIENE